MSKAFSSIALATALLAIAGAISPASAYRTDQRLRLKPFPTTIVAPGYSLVYPSGAVYFQPDFVDCREYKRLWRQTGDRYWREQYRACMSY